MRRLIHIASFKRVRAHSERVRALFFNFERYEMLGKVMRTKQSTRVDEGVEIRNVYRLHERGVSYSTMKRKVGAAKWSNSSTSEIPLPEPLMEMMAVVRIA